MNIFTNLFRKNNEPNKEQHEKINAITLVLGEDNEPFVHISVTNTENDKAIFFAKMLHELNSGKYLVSMINILKELADQDDTINAFINKVMINWKQYQDIEKEQNRIQNHHDPVVKPSDFFKSLKHE
jgi:hypothetical protein